MNDDIRIWEIDDSSKAAKPVESTNRMETENSLEEVLVRNPDLLMPGLTLVGRQTPVDGGKLDLLGVDADGRLVTKHSRHPCPHESQKQAPPALLHRVRTASGSLQLT